jgi:hypothetical protein
LEEVRQEPCVRFEALVRVFWPFEVR